MRLWERDHPLEVLIDRARRAADGQGSVVLVAGEAGIGKTALLRAFAEVSPTPVLWGMCDSLSTPRPLGPLRDVAGELSGEVAAVLREATVQHEIFAAVLEALQDRSRALLVEDLHWGDEATLDLVRFLGRRIDRLPLLLVLSYRDTTGPTDPLRAVLGDLVSAPRARRLQLTPLSRSAVAEMVGGHALDAGDVHARTAGNPFFVSQILAQPDSPLPESVRDAVLARTAPLAADDRRALELLSCAPDGVSSELLAALGIPEATVATLGATGLLDRSGRGVAFRHEIARSAVLDAVTPGAEPALHASMIEALEAVGGDASVLVHHAVAVADVPRILQYAIAAAAEAARSGAHREAVAFYELALPHTGDGAATRAEVLEALAGELYLTDRLHDAIDARTRAVALRRALGDVVAVGAGHCAISLFEWYAADRFAAERSDAAAISILSEAGDPLALGRALANRAYLAAGRGDEALGLQAGRAALQIADELGDAALHTAATIGEALVRLNAGDLQARSHLIAARDTGLRLRLDELVTVPMSNLAHHDVEQGRFAQADEILGDALRFSEERDIPICSMWQRGVLARLRLLQGRWQEAEQDALAVLAVGDVPLGRLWSHLVLGLLAARRDAPAENPHLDELWRLATKLDIAGVLAPVAAALAEQAWILRRPDPRLDESLVTAVAGVASLGGDQVRRWVRRLGTSGVQQVGADIPPPGRPPEQQPYDQALAFWDGGTTQDLLAALPLLDELGARAVAALVRGRLRELGVPNPPRGPSPATRANPAGLTDRQLDVLALLLQGLSNADIAARLVISRKTADHHVSAILAKLGARSRGEAVVAARRLRLERLTQPSR
ncbi:ATP-binding protein [Pseudonocardia sp. CA-107938]|uniref:ATP-binding protein n=1 Tax=Pseudonocardia sp. CA-107938 TaxID=3240021 RepID=UPI003D907C88